MIKLIPKRRAVVTDDDCMVFGKRQYAIFATLLAASGMPVLRSDIIAAAWPDHTPSDPIESLAKSLHHMKPDIADLGGRVEYQNGYYTLVVAP